jgi:hypothetical protein
MLNLNEGDFVKVNGSWAEVLEYWPEDGMVNLIINSEDMLYTSIDQIEDILNIYDLI